jgi:hypothetical protein
VTFDWELRGGALWGPNSVWKSQLKPAENTPNHRPTTFALLTLTP